MGSLYPFYYIEGSAPAANRTGLYLNLAAALLPLVSTEPPAARPSQVTIPGAVVSSAYNQCSSLRVSGASRGGPDELRIGDKET